VEQARHELQHSPVPHHVRRDAVEAVEALTIVLRCRVVRGWRSTLIGVGAASIVLAAIVCRARSALRLIPIGTLRFVVGALFACLRAAVAPQSNPRASGYKPTARRGAAFARRAREGRIRIARRPRNVSTGTRSPSLSRRPARRARSDLHRRHFGSTQGRLALAARPAPPAVIFVVAVGLVLRATSSASREHPQFVVGVLLTSFALLGRRRSRGRVAGGDVAILGVIRLLGLLRSGSRACSARRTAPALRRLAHEVHRARSSFLVGLRRGNDWRVCSGTRRRARPHVVLEHHGVRRGGCCRSPSDWLLAESVRRGRAPAVRRTGPLPETAPAGLRRSADAEFDTAAPHRLETIRGLMPNNPISLLRRLDEGDRAIEVAARCSLRTARSF